jgi:hypothetical protein
MFYDAADRLCERAIDGQLFTRHRRPTIYQRASSSPEAQARRATGGPDVAGDSGGVSCNQLGGAGVGIGWVFDRVEVVAGVFGAG